MKFKPLHDWAVIQRIDAEEKTAGGIIIPDSAREKPAEGIVTAIGPGRFKVEKDKEKKKKFVPTTLKTGQRVIFAKYMATEIELDGDEITLVREDDILGTVEKANELTVRKNYAIKEKPEQPVAIKEKAEIAPVTAKKKPAKKKAAPKKVKPAKKPVAKAKKKVAAVKKTKKTSIKKKSVKKASKKTAKKKTARKSVTKKAAKKKAVKKKAVKKKAAKTGAKKKAAKKTKKKKKTRK